MYDDTCHFLAEHFSADFASWLLGELIALTELKPSELSLDPIRADFVIELRPESDSLQTLQAKMQEYIENGTLLGWLIDPKSQQVEIYRSGQAVEMLQNPETLSGEEILPGFVLNLKPIFSSP